MPVPGPKKPPYKRILKALGNIQPLCAGNAEIADSLAGLIAMLEREEAGSQPAAGNGKEVAA